MKAILRHNADCIEAREEVVKESTIKETSALTKEDFRAFGEFLVRAQELQYKQVVSFLKSLTHRRWAELHVYFAGSLVIEEKSMSHFITLNIYNTFSQETVRRWIGW